MIRVISSPSSSTTGFLTLIFSIDGLPLEGQNAAPRAYSIGGADGKAIRASARSGAWAGLTERLKSAIAWRRLKGATMVSFIVWLIVGGIAGWLAGQLFRGAGFGLIGNILLGVVGSLVAGFLLPRLGVVIGGGFIADVVDAAIGSIIVLAIASFFRRA